MNFKGYIWDFLACAKLEEHAFLNLVCSDTLFTKIITDKYKNKFPEAKSIWANQVNHTWLAQNLEELPLLDISPQYVIHDIDRQTNEFFEILKQKLEDKFPSLYHFKNNKSFKEVGAKKAVEITRPKQWELKRLSSFFNEYFELGLTPHVLNAFSSWPVEDSIGLLNILQKCSLDRDNLNLNDLNNFRAHNFHIVDFIVEKNLKAFFNEALSLIKLGEHASLFPVFAMIRNMLFKACDDTFFEGKTLKTKYEKNLLKIKQSFSQVELFTFLKNLSLMEIELKKGPDLAQAFIQKKMLV